MSVEPVKTPENLTPENLIPENLIPKPVKTPEPVKDQRKILEERKRAFEDRQKEKAKVEEKVENVIKPVVEQDVPVNITVESDRSGCHRLILQTKDTAIYSPWKQASEIANIQDPETKINYLSVSDLYKDFPRVFIAMPVKFMERRV